jgi:hypothetical protein
MALPDAIGLVVEARRRPYEWVEVYVHEDDAAPVYHALVALLDDPSAKPEARSGLLALACQLRRAKG